MNEDSADFAFRPPPQVSWDDETTYEQKRPESLLAICRAEFRAIVNCSYTPTEEMRLMRVSALMI